MWFIIFAFGASIFSIFALAYLFQSQRVAQIKQGPFLVEWQLSDAEFRTWQGYRRRSSFKKLVELTVFLFFSIILISFIRGDLMSGDLESAFQTFVLIAGILGPLFIYAIVSQTAVVKKISHPVLISHQGAVVGTLVYAFNQDSVWKRTVVLETEEIEGQLWSKLVFTVNDTGRKNGKYTLELPVPVDKQKEAEYLAAVLTLEPQAEEV